MDVDGSLDRSFEEHRAHLRAVGYRMLGSFSETDDALQEAWLRASRADTTGVENIGGWLTTVMARVCLNALRRRRRRPEDPLDVHVPDVVVERDDGPEQQALLTDSVGLALLVVLDTLAPAERLAFVLHDMFAVPFEDIAPIVERTPTATRQLASRARRRVQASTPRADADLGRQRVVVDAFLAASRDGDFDALLAVLDPDVVLRADTGAPTGLVRGAVAVARQALLFSRLARFRRPAIVNGAIGIVTAPEGQAASVMAFTIAGGRIVEIDILADPVRIAALDLTDVTR